MILSSQETFNLSFKTHLKSTIVAKAMVGHLRSFSISHLIFDKLHQSRAGVLASLKSSALLGHHQAEETCKLCADRISIDSFLGDETLYSVPLFSLRLPLLLVTCLQSYNFALVNSEELGC